jgi:serine/threonine protein kinase
MTDFDQRLKDTLSNTYDIERELGGAGMSRVYVATEKSLGRKVVIKVLSPELTADVSRSRFRREIQVAAQLQHPHIVPLLSAGVI